MKDNITQKLIEAQDRLGLKIPGNLFRYIANLEETTVTFGNDEWRFEILEDDEDTNAIAMESKYFKTDWNLDAIVFATNWGGDALLLLIDQQTFEPLPQVFVMLHEVAEIKVFVESWDALLANGPADFDTQGFYVKLDADENLVWGDGKIDTSAEDFMAEMALKSKMDDLFDDQIPGTEADLISGLENLAQSTDKDHRIWALNKLSEIYFQGFLSVKPNLELAHRLTDAGIELGSYRALSSKAFCYYSGYGIGKDLDKALELATKANERSKDNSFINIVADETGGLYGKLIEMIKSQMR